MSSSFISNLLIKSTLDNASNLTLWIKIFHNSYMFPKVSILYERNDTDWTPYSMAVDNEFLYIGFNKDGASLLVSFFLELLGESLNNYHSKNKTKKKQETFREHRHLHVCDLWPWIVTLTLSQGQKDSCHSMSLIVLYLGTSYNVCERYTLRDMTISSFFVTFDLRLWPLSSVKVTFIFIVK